MSTISELTTSSGARPCAFCKLNVLTSRHALQCTLCNQWQHRVCHRGNKSDVNYEDYIDLIEKRKIFTWHCVNCPLPGPHTFEVDTLVDNNNTFSSCNDTACSDVLFIHEDTVASCNDTTCLDTQNDCDNTSVILNDITSTGQSHGDSSIDMTALLQEYGDTFCFEPSAAYHTDTHTALVLDNITEHNASPCIERDMSKDCSVIDNFLKELRNAEDGDKTLPFEQQPTLCTPFEMHKECTVDELDQFEDGDNTLIDEPQYPTLNTTLNCSIMDVETIIEQDEVSTIIFPHGASPLCQASPALSLCSLSDTKLSINDISMASVSFKKAVVKQSTPISSHRTYHRQARSLLRRISVIRSLPEIDLSCASADLTPNCFSTRSKTYKRRLSTEDEYPASKKRIIESP